MEWEHYWELTGTGAVTLIGLLFVVITLGAERAEHGDRRLLRIYLTPTLVHFGVVLLIALLALSPEGDSLILPFGLIGIAGLVYSLSTAVKTARNERLFSEAWLPWRHPHRLLCGNYYGRLAWRDVDEASVFNSPRRFGAAAARRNAERLGCRRRHRGEKFEMIITAIQRAPALKPDALARSAAALTDAGHCTCARPVIHLASRTLPESEPQAATLQLFHRPPGRADLC